MVHETEIMKRQMAETRSSLAEKISTLEGHLADAVESVSSKTKETVGVVNEFVRESVQTLQNALDLKHQVERQPLAALAASICVGFVCGRIFGPSTIVHVPSSAQPY